jgi:hypothetical protein
MISPFAAQAAVAASIPILPDVGQAVLSQALSLPLPPETTIIQGIFQSDVIIRSSIEAALMDMRANPWVLDYVFSSLKQDVLTYRQYGQASLDAAKNWFLTTNIPVLMVPVMNELKVPAITISLVSSSEVVAEATTADTHHQPFEDNDSNWPALTSGLKVVSYKPSSGSVIINSLPDTVTLCPGMFLVDAAGRGHEILTVTGDLSFTIPVGVVANFNKAVLKPARPAFITAIESSSYRESYRVGVHVGAEPAMLTWLHSIVIFALHRYKEALLEARGFERSTTESTDFQRDGQFETEHVFSRYINLSGHVRHSWPKLVTPKISGVKARLQVSGDGIDVSSDYTGVDVNTQLWSGNLDKLK